MFGISKKKLNLRVVGAAIIVVGIPLGMYLDFFFRISIKWTNIFMALSIMCLFSGEGWKNLLRLKLSNIPILKIIVIFQIIMMLYGMGSPNMSSQYFLHHVYTILICIAFMVNKKIEEYYYLPEVVFFLSIPCLIFAVFCCATELVVGETAYLLRKQMGEDLFNLDALTICSGTLNSIYAIMCFNKKGIIWKCFLVVTIVAASYVLLTCGKRTPLFMLFVFVLLYVFFKRTISLKMTITQFRNIVFFLTIFVLCYSSIEFVQQSVDSITDSFFHGVKSLAGMKDNQASLSVDERIVNRKWTFDYIENKFNFLNYIFGVGYNTRWIDFPILQSYLDMGVIGFVFYGGIVALYPILIILKRINNNIIILAISFAIYGMLGIFSTSHPYSYMVYTRVALLAFMYMLFKKQYRRRKFLV